MCKHSRLVTQKDRSPSGKALTQVTPAAHAPQVSMVRNCRHPSGSMKKAEFPLLRCRTFRALGTTQQLLTQARAALPGKTPSSLATARSWRMSFTALAHTTDTASPEGSIHGAERSGAEHSRAEPSRATYGARLLAGEPSSSASSQLSAGLRRGRRPDWPDAFLAVGGTSWAGCLPEEAWAASLFPGAGPQHACAGLAVG